MSKHSSDIKSLSFIVMISTFLFAFVGILCHEYFMQTVASQPTSTQTLSTGDDALEDTISEDATLLQTLKEALEGPAYIILNYHHIDADITDNPITITPELFGEHIHALRTSNYQPIHYEQLTKFLQISERARLTYFDDHAFDSETGNASLKFQLSEDERETIVDNIRFLNTLPERGYHITFDDGYESFYRHAYPILQEQKIPATFFVIVRSSKKALETAPAWINFPHVTWEQLQIIQRQPLFEVQSHTYSLHSYETADAKQAIPSLSGQIYRKELGRVETQEEFLERIYQDMILSKSYLENRLRPHIANGLSYPYGVYNDAVIEMAKKADIAYLFTNQPGTVTYKTLPFKIPRLNAGIPELGGDGLLLLLNKYLRDSAN